MKIGIIGGGSIGLLLSAYLSEQHTVTIYVDRKEQLETLRSNELELLKSSKPVKKVSVFSNYSSSLWMEDCYIICVKQSHIDAVLPLFKRLHNDIPLIFLQNGMGHINKVKVLPNPLYVGVVEHGASRVADARVNHLGEGKIKLASLTGNAEGLTYLLNELHQETFPFEREEDWELLLKEKLIINAVINPLTALFNVSNGTITTNESIRFLARNLCKEAATVLELDQDHSWDRIKKTAFNTKENTSSMRADIQYERKTEIEAISGFIINHAKNDVPYTEFVYHSILALEKKGEQL